MHGLKEEKKQECFCMLRPPWVRYGAKNAYIFILHSIMNLCAKFENVSFLNIMFRRRTKKELRRKISEKSFVGCMISCKNLQKTILSIQTFPLVFFVEFLFYESHCGSSCGLNLMIVNLIVLGKISHKEIIRLAVGKIRTKTGNSFRTYCRIALEGLKKKNHKSVNRSAMFSFRRVRFFFCFKGEKKLKFGSICSGW